MGFGVNVQGGRLPTGMRAVFYLAALATLTGCSSASADAPEALVYKSPTCGCCEKWIEHLEANGFKVKTEDVMDMGSVKVEHGITGELAACHTALIEGYVIEGHVPADVIMRLLDERPDIAGLAVPGMPLGSPGMEGPYVPQEYDVLAFDKQGTVQVYESR